MLRRRFFIIKVILLYDFKKTKISSNPERILLYIGKSLVIITLNLKHSIKKMTSRLYTITNIQ